MSVRPKYSVQVNSEENERGELKKIQEQISHVENVSLESTRRTLSMLNEAKEVGVKTSEELVRQGEKLKAIDENLDKIDNDLTQTQKNLNKLKSVFGGLKNKLSFKSARKSSSSTSASTTVAKCDCELISNAEMCTDETRTSYAVISGSEREKELNKNLEEMSQGLKMLANLGLDMNRELSKQDPMLDRMNNKTEKNNARIDNQTEQMKRLLK